MDTAAGVVCGIYLFRWLFQAEILASPHHTRSPKAAKILEFGSPGCGKVVTCCSRQNCRSSTTSTTPPTDAAGHVGNDNFESTMASLSDGNDGRGR